MLSGRSCSCTGKGGVIEIGFGGTLSSTRSICVLKGTKWVGTSSGFYMTSRFKTLEGLAVPDYGIRFRF